MVSVVWSVTRHQHGAHDIGELFLVLGLDANHGSDGELVHVVGLDMVVVAHKDEVGGRAPLLVGLLLVEPFLTLVGRFDVANLADEYALDVEQGFLHPGNAQRLPDLR